MPALGTAFTPWPRQSCDAPRRERLRSPIGGPPRLVPRGEHCPGGGSPLRTLARISGGRDQESRIRRRCVAGCHLHRYPARRRTVKRHRSLTWPSDGRANYTRSRLRLSRGRAGRNRRSSPRRGFREREDRHSSGPEAVRERKLPRSRDRTSLSVAGTRATRDLHERAARPSRRERAFPR